MSRAKREAFFFLVFQREKSLFITGHARRVGRLFDFLCKCVCLWVYFNIVIDDIGRPHSTHTTPMPVLTGCVHAHILTKPSRAGFAVSRSELMEPGAEKCVFTGMDVPGKSTSIIYHNVLFCCGEKSAERGLSQLYR